MQIIAIITVLAPVVFAAATCYTGDNFAEQATTRWHAERACNGYDGKTGAFQGIFGPGETKSACVQQTATQRVDMSVQNLNNGQGFDLGDADCSLRLDNIINACVSGGQEDVAGWRFKVDPSSGKC